MCMSARYSTTALWNCFAMSESSYASVCLKVMEYFLKFHDLGFMPPFFLYHNHICDNLLSQRNCIWSWSVIASTLQQYVVLETGGILFPQKSNWNFFYYFVMSSIFHHRNIFYLILAFYLAAPKWVAHHALQLSQWFPSKWCLTFHKWLAKLGNILSPGKIWWNSWVESSDMVAGWTLSAFWSFSKATPLTGSWSACPLSGFGSSSP